MIDLSLGSTDFEALRPVLLKAGLASVEGRFRESGTLNPLKTEVAFDLVDSSDLEAHWLTI